MSIPDEISEYLDHIVKSILGIMVVREIYLFGSFAKGDFHEDSDIDIYVVTPDKSKRIIDYRKEISFAIGFPKKIGIDILVGYEEDFDRKKTLLNFVENEIMEHGVLLYANK